MLHFGIAYRYVSFSTAVSIVYSVILILISNPSIKHGDHCKLSYASSSAMVCSWRWMRFLSLLINIISTLPALSCNDVNSLSFFFSFFLCLFLSIFLSYMLLPSLLSNFITLQSKQKYKKRRRWIRSSLPSLDHSSFDDNEGKIAYCYYLIND